MSESQSVYVPFVKSILHPTDFSEESEQAFAHALATALIRKTKLTILHVDKEYSEVGLKRFPAVRKMLEQWGLLEKGSSSSAVFDKLGITVQKVDIQGRNPVNTTLSYLDKHPTDLIVLATKGREGLARWINPSVAEQMARKSETMTLFVPDSVRGFVSVEDGHISLQHILIPVDHHPSPHSAIVHANRAARAVGKTPAEITLIHVDDSTDMPVLDLPESPSWSWKTLKRSGKVVDEITAAANEYNVDLIAMATQGHKGVFGAIHGSVTEQVLRHAPCPVLAVPMSRLPECPVLTVPMSRPPETAVGAGE